MACRRFRGHSGLVMALIALVILGTAAGACTKAEKDVFPTESITLIVPFAAGGGADVIARKLAPKVEQTLGKPVLVVNKPGGSAAVALVELANARPDGHTILIANANLAIHAVRGTEGIKVENYAPVVGVGKTTGVITVRADAPWNSMQEFVEDAKRNPGKIKFGTSAPGAIYHLVSVYLEKLLGIKTNLIPQATGAGSMPNVNLLLGGHLDAALVLTNEALPHFQAGKLRVLAIIGPNRLEAFPGVPTLKELGINLVSEDPRMIIAPKGTPPSRIKKLQDAFKVAVEDPEYKKWMSQYGWEAYYESSEEVAASLKEQLDFFAKAVAEAEGAGQK